MVASELSQAARADPQPSQLAAQQKEQEPAPPLVNRVGQSKSPYVRSHAEGRVAWQLLDEEAIERARKENKLIFLHIGFKACHYSRLTSTECFTHRECAAILNESFIPVIIDREERPELDTIYMNYVQAVSGSGGWPLNLFLTPELEPVFGGTYYPAPGPNNGGSDDEERLDFLAILRKLQKVWREQESRCRQEAKEVVVKLHDFAAEGTLGTATVQPGVAGSQITAIFWYVQVPDAAHQAVKNVAVCRGAVSSAFFFFSPLYRSARVISASHACSASHASYTDWPLTGYFHPLLPW